MAETPLLISRAGSRSRSAPWRKTAKSQPVRPKEESKEPVMLMGITEEALQARKDRGELEGDGTDSKRNGVTQPVNDSNR